MPGRIKHFHRRYKKNDEEAMASTTIDSDGTTTESNPTDGHPANDGPIQMPQNEKEGGDDEEEEPQMNILATLVSSELTLLWLPC
jgi:hypothetical protein